MPLAGRKGDVVGSRHVVTVEDRYEAEPDLRPVVTGQKLFRRMITAADETGEVAGMAVSVNNHPVLLSLNQFGKPGSDVGGQPSFCCCLYSASTLSHSAVSSSAVHLPLR